MLIPWLRRDPVIRQHLAEEASLYVSTVALGELYYGAEKSVHVEKSLAEVGAMINTVTILTVDSATATIYGRIKYEQQVKGLMLPDNDLWIAATAMQYGLTLATRDHHFNWLDGLALEQW